MNQKFIETRIGEVMYTKYGEKMTIIEYVNRNNIIVLFETGYITNARYQNFKKGNIQNVYRKSVYGIGFIGEGKYIADKKEHIYGVWNDMIRRCYSKEFQEKKKPSYKGCMVCEEWHNFQNFAKWYKENYYAFNNEIMQLDKDIILSGNKIYSPTTCIIVPNSINTLFKQDKRPTVDHIIDMFNDTHKDIPNKIKEIILNTYKNI